MAIYLKHAACEFRSVNLRIPTGMRQLIGYNIQSTKESNSELLVWKKNWSIRMEIQCANLFLDLLVQL